MSTKPPVMQLGRGIRNEDYAYSVEIAGSKYDVYHFHKDGKPGTLAFRYHHPMRRFEVAVMCGGHLTKELTTERIKEGLAERLN